MIHKVYSSLVSWWIDIDTKKTREVHVNYGQIKVSCIGKPMLSDWWCQWWCHHDIGKAQLPNWKLIQMKQEKNMQNTSKIKVSYIEKPVSGDVMCWRIKFWLLKSNFVLNIDIVLDWYWPHHELCFSLAQFAPYHSLSSSLRGCEDQLVLLPLELLCAIICIPFTMLVRLLCCSDDYHTTTST